MNNMKYTIRILLMGLLLVGLTGCHQRVFPTEEEQGDGCERMVRITARILPTGAPLRANDGDVQDDKDDDPDTPFDPEVVDPYSNKRNFDEDRVDHVMLYVYDKGQLIKTVFYHDPTFTAGMPTAFDGLEVKTFGKDRDTFTFDLMLSSGRYRFVLLVNDPQCYYEAKNGKIRRPEKIYLDQMTSDRGLITTEVLMKAQTGRRRDYSNGTHPRALPMTGQAMLSIPKGNDDGTPKTVTPSIDLERIMARVEIILTTADKEKMEYLSPEIANYRPDNREYVDGTTTGRLTKGRLVDLVDRDWRAGTLEILPTKGEYTATGRGMPEESRLYSDRTATDYLQYFRNADTYRTTVTTLYAQDMDERNALPSLNKMYHQRSKSQTGKFTLKFFYLYIPPMFIDGLKKEDMPYILIGVNTTGEPIAREAPVRAEQMTYFRLPITTLVSAAGGGIEEKFEVRRNTIYSIYATFRGGRLILNDGIKVLPWKVENETIEVDINDAKTPPVYPIDK